MAYCAIILIFVIFIFVLFVTLVVSILVYVLSVDLFVIFVAFRFNFCMLWYEAYGSNLSHGGECFCIAVVGTLSGHVCLLRAVTACELSV